MHTRAQPIRTWDTTSRNVFAGTRIHDYRVLLSRALNRTIRTMPLTNPTFHGDTVVVGGNTDDGGGLVFACDLRYLNEEEGFLSQPVIAALPFQGQFLDQVRNLENFILVGSTGRISGWELDLEARRFTHSFDLRCHASTAHIRDMVRSPTNRNVLASSSNDGLLAISDLTTGQLLNRVTIENTPVGSIRWDEQLTFTSDDGRFWMYDLRQRDPDLIYCTEEPLPLYTHCRYNQFYTLLGFGDRMIRNIDFRHPNHMINYVMDPVVAGVGHIEYNQAASSFLVSGFLNYGVWSHDTSQNSARLQVFSDKQNTDLKFANLSTFLTDRDILSSTSDGCLEVAFF